MTTIDRTTPGRAPAVRPLLAPREARAEVPLARHHEQVVHVAREEVAAVLEGRDDRLLVVVGPCSIHDPVAALDYAGRLARLAEELRGHLVVVMRAYFEKPRSSLGWKGFLNDPGLDGTHRVDAGILAARSLLVGIVALGLPVGCEFHDPLTPPYHADAVSWAAIGARTVESQVHRQLASGLAMPVGFKNPTSGDVRGAIDALVAAAVPQHFPGIADDGRAAVLATRGNPDGHVVLRGGASGPNHAPVEIAAVLDLLERRGLVPRVVVDASHGNSGKDHHRQADVVRDLGDRLASGEAGIAGVMIESFLEPGRQDLDLGDPDALVYGRSITDACIGWEASEALLGCLADAVDARRSLS